VAQTEEQQRHLFGGMLAEEYYASRGCATPRPSSPTPVACASSLRHGPRVSPGKRGLCSLFCILRPTGGTLLCISAGSFDVAHPSTEGCRIVTHCWCYITVSLFSCVIVLIGVQPIQSPRPWSAAATALATRSSWMFQVSLHAPCQDNGLCQLSRTSQLDLSGVPAAAMPHTCGYRVSQWRRSYCVTIEHTDKTTNVLLFANFLWPSCLWGS